MKSNGKESKHEHIVGMLRREILAGVFAPGTRLPNQSALAHRFQVGNGTITQVLQRLSREGFITATPKVGTVVRDKLPHLNNIAIALPQAMLGDAHWSKYHAALASAVESLRKELDRPIRVLESLDDPLGAARRDLTELIQTHQVAGVFFATSPHVLYGTPILNEPGVPRVAIMALDPRTPVDTSISVNADFMPQALDYLASRGRRRIAVLSNPGSIGRDESQLQRLLAARTMVCPPCWDIALNLDSIEAAKNVMRLMMRTGQTDRPDGLIITNDNLVDDAIAGLVAQGIKVPEDLEVVAHCNFPWPPVKVMPIQRLGLDVRAVLRLGIDLIDRRRAGKKIPKVVTVPAVWEHNVGR